MKNLKIQILFILANTCLVLCQLFTNPDFAYVNMTATTNTLLPYRDLAACECDLTYNFCDNFCCCDPDCASGLIYDWQLENLCFEETTNVPTKFPLCSSFPGIFSNLLTLDSRQEDTLTCLAFENRPYMGYFYNEMTTSQTQAQLFQMLDSSNDQLIGFTTDENDYNNVNSNYQIGDYLIANNTSGYTLINNLYSIPTVDIFGFCQDNNFVKYFLDMDPITCLRTFNIDDNCNENGTLSAYKLLEFYSIQSGPQSSVFANLQIMSANTIDLTTGAQTSKNISSNADLKPNQTTVDPAVPTCTCSNVLKQADFYFMVANQSIQNVSVELVFYDLIPENMCNQTLKIEQSFSFKFLTGSFDIFYEKSGNPGYIFGKPLMNGYMANYVNGEGILMPNGGIPFNVSLSDGSCYQNNTNATGNIPYSNIYFGQDQELSCTVNINLQTLQNMCSVSAIENFAIFNNFNSDQNIYFGRYGNANPLYIKDWIVVSNPETLASKNINYDQTKLMCHLPTTTLITIFYSRSGATSNLQKYIVYAEKTFATNSYWQFSKLNLTQNQSFSLFLKIQFLEISEDLLNGGAQVATPDYFGTWLSSVFRPFSITPTSNVFSEILKNNIVILMLFWVILVILSSS